MALLSKLISRPSAGRLLNIYKAKSTTPQLEYLSLARGVPHGNSGCWRTIQLGGNSGVYRSGYCSVSGNATQRLGVLLQEETTQDDLASTFFPSRLETSGLQHLFQPRSVAVIGATERPGSVGRTLVNNLMNSRKEKNAPYEIYPVNPTRQQVFGLKCYPSITAIPHDVDMAVLVTPAKSCVEAMRQCAQKNVKAAVVISAEFREAGPHGRALEDELISVAQAARIRVVGPNCLGIMNPVYGLNATFASTMGKSGRLAFISQSGAMCTSVLDWSLKENVGFSAFVSVGGMADVNWGDLLDFLGDDSNTSAILMYMEGAGDAQAFLSAAQEVVMKKPVIVIKAGKSEAAAAAAASHTGSLAGSYQSFEAAMRRVGVTVVDNIQQLFDCALVLAKQPQPKGPNLLMITNAGGPAVLATDATVSSGAFPAVLSNSLKDKLNTFLPEAWSHANPVDILGDASAERYSKTLETILFDEEQSNASDGVLVILSPQDVTDPKESAIALVNAVEKAKKKGKTRIPILAAWMGGVTVQEGAEILSRAGIPVFSNPDEAASTFGRLWKQREALDILYKSTTLSQQSEKPLIEDYQINTQQVKDLLTRVKQSNRFLLTEEESKRILKEYGLDVVPTFIAKNETEAVEAAKTMKESLFAIKLHSETLTHKADVGGVHLNVPLKDIPKAVEAIRSSVKSTHGLEHFQGVTVQPMINLTKGIELILGSTVDPQFGPLVMFGSGGSMVEIFRDTSLAVPPLTHNLSEMLMKNTRIFKALKGAQGKRFQGVDLNHLATILYRFSRMITDLSDDIAECDINPLLATTDGRFIALDARFVLANPSSTVPVIRPCPYEYTTALKTPS